MKLGGLLNELKNKIDDLNNYNNHLEIKINKLENDNSQLNWEYDQSYYIPPGLANHYDYKKLYEETQDALKKAQQDNLKKDASGSKDEKTDSEILMDFARSFM